MSDNNFEYDIPELRATAKIAKTIIRCLEKSIERLENPHEETHETISEEWVFVSSLKTAMTLNKRLISFGAHHGLTCQLDGFELNEDREFTHEMNPIFKSDEKEEGIKKQKQEGLGDILEEILRSIKKS